MTLPPRLRHQEVRDECVAVAGDLRFREVSVGEATDNDKAQVVHFDRKGNVLTGTTKLFGLNGVSGAIEFGDKSISLSFLRNCVGVEKIDVRRAEDQPIETLYLAGLQVRI